MKNQKIPTKVMWQEGMLMTPQHLQQQDLYHEDLLNFRLQALNPFTWGVSHCIFDPIALSQGSIKITAFSGILKNGEILAFSAYEGDTPPSRLVPAHLFTSNFGDTPKTLIVYLGVPHLKFGRQNISPLDNPQVVPTPATETPLGLTHYQSTTRLVPDLIYEQGEPASLTFAIPRPCILFSSELQQDYHLLPIAKIKQTHPGSIELCEDFIPPCLRITASVYLQKELTHLAALLQTKRLELLEICRHREGATVEFQGSDITAYLQLALINNILPLLQIIPQNPEISVFTIYTLLLQLTMHLSTFTPGGETPKSTQELLATPFNYEDLYQTFAPLFSYLTTALNQVVLTRYQKLNLLRENKFLVAKLPPELLTKTPLLILSVKSPKITSEEIAQKIPKIAKISTKNLLPHILQAATEGLPLKISHRPPAEIFVKADTVYFILDNQHPHWKHLLEEQSLALYIPSPFDSEQITYELFLLPAKDS